MLHLTCGYAQTGKDSLHQLLVNGGQIKAPTPDILQAPVGGWLIYAAIAAPPDYGEGKSLQRVAFADALKRESFPELGLPGVYSDYESLKNTWMVTPADGKPKTLRQHWIDYGAKGREQDIDMWPKKALSSHFDAEHKHHTNVTDFRFTSELKYVASKTTAYDTTRVYRSEVPMANKDVQSEHELDDFQTTYLLVTSVEEFNKALKLFPQYIGYELRWILKSIII